jgi:hypothetical protein
MRKKDAFSIIDAIGKNAIVTKRSLKCYRLQSDFFGQSAKKEGGQ